MMFRNKAGSKYNKMTKKSITRTVFYEVNDDDFVPCPVCGTPEFEKENFPGIEEICGICTWYNNTSIYYGGNIDESSLNESSKEVNSLQAKENYKRYLTASLRAIEVTRKSIIQKLVYTFKLEEKNSADWIVKDKSVWYYLEKIIGELFYPRFSYDDMDKVKSRIDKFYDAKEAISLNKFAIDFRQFMERLDLEQTDEVYISDQEWPKLQKQALELVELMTTNNHKYHFEYSYIPYKDILSKNH